MQTLFHVIISSFLLCATAAWTQEKPRTIDFTQVLLDATGRPFKASPTTAPLTLQDVSIESLDGVLDADRQTPPTPEEKFLYDSLARKIYHNKAAVLTAAEINLLEQRIGKAYGAAVVGAAWRLLDPAQVK